MAKYSVGHRWLLATHYYIFCAHATRSREIDRHSFYSRSLPKFSQSQRQLQLKKIRINQTTKKHFSDTTAFVSLLSFVFRNRNASRLNTLVEPQNPPINVFELHKVRRSV